MDSDYDDARAIAEGVKLGRHREIVGGLWDEIGRLQLDFLISRGLKPSDRLLDIGCGALRGGVRFIAYLDPGNYWGIDKNEPLLQAGRDLELPRHRLGARQPAEQIKCLTDFEFFTLPAQFDCAIAQSLFTHLSLNRIRRCLARLAPSLRPGASLYASYFERDPSIDREDQQIHHPGGMTSHSDRSFYHYDHADFAFAAKDLPYSLEYLGLWDHPRGQRMVRFERV